MGLLQNHKKLEKKKQNDRNQRAEAFVAEYKKLSEKYQMDFSAELQFAPNGIKPILRMKDLAMPEMKPWSEAKKENLEARKACKHKLREKEQDCGTCGLAKEHWGENDKGATQEYIDKTEAAINEIKKAEEEERKERETLQDEEEAEEKKGE